MKICDPSFDFVPAAGGGGPPLHECPCGRMCFPQHPRDQVFPRVKPKRLTSSAHGTGRALVLGVPSMLHETLVALFKNNPSLAPEVLRTVFGVRIPKFTHARTESSDFADIAPAEYGADVVVLLERENPVLAIVVEVQLWIKREKRYTWPVYLAELRARLKCPTCLLVVCTKPKVAAWCAKPIMLGHPGFALQPFVLGYEAVPLITDPQKAVAMPELAVLSAMAHGKGAHGLEVGIAAFTAIAGLDDEHAALYNDLVLAAVNASARKALEELMIPEGYEFQSDFAKKYFGKGKAEGRAEGEAKGKAESILSVLSARRLDVPDDVRVKVLACSDPEVLDRWLRRAVTVESTEKLFRE